MKIRRLLTLLVMAAVASATAFAAKPVPGPKGGKMLTTEAPLVECFVAADHTVVVSFYDRDLRLVAPAGQVVSAVAEAKAGKTTLRFGPKDGALVSTAPLPAGDGYRVVLQVREAANAKPRNFRLDLNLAECGGCKRAEYACTCEGH